jgi:hypothetical protein
VKNFWGKIAGKKVSHVATKHYSFNTVQENLRRCGIQEKEISDVGCSTGETF